LISAARFVDSGFSQKENIVSSAILGLFAQLVCYHFELGLIIRMSNALSTCFSVRAFLCIWPQGTAQQTPKVRPRNHMSLTAKTSKIWTLRNSECGESKGTSV
jgi:hypothetical protein